ncbi:MAG: hypothetical protein ACOCXG_03825 [Nanoarchaeota archaeon]
MDGVLSQCSIRGTLESYIEKELRKRCDDVELLICPGHTSNQVYEFNRKGTMLDVLNYELEVNDDPVGPVEVKFKIEGQGKHARNYDRIRNTLFGIMGELKQSFSISLSQEDQFDLISNSPDYEFMQTGLKKIQEHFPGYECFMTESDIRIVRYDGGEEDSAENVVVVPYSYETTGSGHGKFVFNEYPSESYSNEAIKMSELLTILMRAYEERRNLSEMPTEKYERSKNN